MLVANIDHKFIYDINLILYLLIWLIWFYFHISKLCSTAATQLNVLSRLKKYMGKKWWKLQGLGSLSKSKRKIKKTYPREYSYIFQKKKKNHTLKISYIPELSPIWSITQTLMKNFLYFLEKPPKLIWTKFLIKWDDFWLSLE